MRKVELYNPEQPKDRSAFVSFFADKERLSAWLEDYQANGTGLVRAMKRASAGSREGGGKGKGEGANPAVAWMTNPLNPPFRLKENVSRIMPFAASGCYLVSKTRITVTRELYQDTLQTGLKPQAESDCDRSK